MINCHSKNSLFNKIEKEIGNANNANIINYKFDK